MKLIKQRIQRRDFMTGLSGCVLAAMMPNAVPGKGTMTSKPTDYIVFVGTYTSGKSEGIYIYRFDHETGALHYGSKITGIKNPSFLALDPQKKYLYAVSETMSHNGTPGGAIRAYFIDPKTKEARFINQQPTQGGAPCYVSVDALGKWVFAANYMGGNVAVYPILESGGLGSIACLIQHHGSSVNPKRQQAPHPHSIQLDRNNRYAFVPDLGLDKIMIYALNPKTGELTPNSTPWVSTKPGAGPRHFAFHPSGNYAFLIQEINSTITSYAYDSTQGTLKEIQTVSTLPQAYTGSNSCADIHVSPSGKFLYGSNRGHDSIVQFSIDESTGKLTYIAHESTQGKTPRNFAIDPTGTFLLAANQETDTVVTFRIDSQSGRLTPTGHIENIPTPVCLKIVPYIRY